MNAAPMKSVVVGGGGIVAWSVAAAIRRHIPSLQVTVVSCPIPSEALADRMICTLPSIAGFHEDLGLPEADTMHNAKSGLRLGTIFEGWSSDLPPYVHGYGSYGQPIDGVPFYLLWLRARAAGETQPFDQFSAAAQLGRSGRIGSAADASTPAPEIGYGRCLTMERYHALMRDYALYLGAIERRSRGFEPKRHASNGFVAALALEEGAIVAGDLFVDCTGPAASIRSALGGEFEDWSAFLPCDSLLFTQGPPDPGAAMLDRVAATDAGWQWQASSPALSSRGIAFSSSYSNQDEAVRRLGGADAEAIAVSIRQGCWNEPWIKNCVAIGDSAVMVEPLEWANLHLAHSQIDRLISMMPGSDCAPVELAEYNRQCTDEARRVRDFISMHYIVARRNEPFWKELARNPAPSLAHSLALFAERGRLPFYEEETFSRDSWAAVLLGQGFEPRRIDPLARSVPIDRIRLELLRHSDFIRGFVGSQPMYSDYISKPPRQGLQ